MRLRVRPSELINANEINIDRGPWVQRETDKFSARGCSGKC